MIATQADSLQDAFAPSREVAAQIGSPSKIIALAQQHSTLLEGSKTALMSSSIVAQAQPVLGTTLPSFKLIDDADRILGAVPLRGFASTFGDISKGFGSALVGDLFKTKHLGEGLKISAVLSASRSFKDFPADLGKTLGVSSAVIKSMAIGVEMQKLMAPPIGAVLNRGVIDLRLDIPSPWLGFGIGRSDSKTGDRSVDAWLDQKRRDLRQKYQGMWTHSETVETQCCKQPPPQSSCSRTSSSCWGCHRRTFICGCNRILTSRILWTRQTAHFASRGRGVFA